MATFYHLSVKEIVQETHNSVSIAFHIPESIQKVFEFTAGQYITIQKELNGEQVRRDYSICSSQNFGELKVGIKAVEGGLFSQYATKEIKVGDELEISEPRGRFLLKTDVNNKNNYLAFAAGSGITPILSMIKSSLTIEPLSKFVLVYGNKTTQDVMFKKDLDTLLEKYPNRFFLHSVFSQFDSNQHFKGRINESIVKTVVSELYRDTIFNDYFLCGPETMINSAKETLITNGVDTSAIHFELFTPSNATAESEVSDKAIEGEATITILLDDEEETFTMPKDKTILERALLQGLDAPYSCQGGICSSCIAKVTEGKASMEKNSILDDDEVEEGLILTCQAHPITDTIKIDYDDV